jgi:hypothetical protein
MLYIGLQVFVCVFCNNAWAPTGFVRYDHLVEKRIYFEETNTHNLQ